MAEELPASLGGPPIRPEGPPAWPFPDHEVAAAFGTAFGDGSWGQYLGPHVPRLETALCESHNVAHALTCATGTLAVEIALRTLGVGRGDEVILAAYEFEPSFLAVHAIGATPVLVDVSPRNPGIDLARLDAAIGPATKAVVATHLHGGLVAMSALMAIAKNRGVRVVEDAAQLRRDGRGPAGRIVGRRRCPEFRRQQAAHGRSWRGDALQEHGRLAARSAAPCAGNSAIGAAERDAGSGAVAATSAIAGSHSSACPAVATLVKLLRDIPGLRWIETNFRIASPRTTSSGSISTRLRSACRVRPLSRLSRRRRRIRCGVSCATCRSGTEPLQSRRFAGTRGNRRPDSMVMLHHPVLSLGAWRSNRLRRPSGKRIVMPPGYAESRSSPV